MEEWWKKQLEEVDIIEMVVFVVWGIIAITLCKFIWTLPAYIKRC